MIPGLGGADPRQMAMMMRKMGIDVREVEGVEEVVVRTAEREYRFRKASVTVMKAQGQETWQVQGRPEVVERKAPGPAAGASPAQPAPAAASGASPPAASPAVPAEDVRLVMQQAGCGEAAAREALEATGGDLAEAILRLSR